MRTTVELSERTYRRLRDAATERGLRGFSPLVEEALSLYLENQEERDEAFKAAAGAWSEEDVREWEEAVREAWSTWRTNQS